MSSVAAGVPTNLSQHQQRGRRQAAAVAAGSGVVQSSTRMRAARTGLLGRATAFTSSMLAPAAAARDASSNASSKVAHAAAARAARGDGASPGDGDAKARALESTLKEINSRFGKNSIMKMGETTYEKIVTTPSGALTLDLALGGGYPKGRLVEIYGPESSGKTTLALHAMAEVQKAGGSVALIDAEHAFDPVFAKRLGVDVDRLLMCQPDSGEMALEVADSLIRSSAVDMVAVDSVAALVPRAELEGEIGQVQVGGQARLMSGAMRKLAGNASKHNCTIIFINQLRQKVGVIYGSPEVTSGGQALKYYASVRLEVRIKEKISAGTDGQIGIRVKANVKKNKVAPPYKLAEFDILFGGGISATGCLLDAAEAVNVVQRRGSWYSWGETRLAQGRDKTLDMIKADPELYAKIEAQTRHVLAGKDINELYEKEAHVVEESYAEGDGVLREQVPEQD